MIIELDYVFTFGKYKGRTAYSVIRENPQYLFWAEDNIDWFELSDDVKEEAFAHMPIPRRNNAGKGSEYEGSLVDFMYDIG